MNYLQISQWVDRSRDTDKFLEPRKWSVFSASSPSCTYCDILISFPVSDRHPVPCRETTVYFLSSQNLGALKSPIKHQKTPTQSPLPSYPSNSITCQGTKNPLEKNIFCICCGNLLVILSVSQFKLKAQLFFSGSARRLQAALKSFQMGTVVSSSFQFYKNKRDLWINWNNKRNVYGAIYWILNSFELTAPTNEFNIILSCLPEEINTSEGTLPSHKFSSYHWVNQRRVSSSLTFTHI